MTPKFKKGNLYLYNPVYAGGVKSKFFVDIPVLTLCKNKNYSTWLCYFPNGTTGGCHPEDLKDITKKND